MTHETDHAKDQAMAQCASIREMVAALECDYDRLDELRNDRDCYVQTVDAPPDLDTPEQWAIDCPDDAAELAELEASAGDCKDRDEAEQHIHEDALSVEIRSSWTSLGEKLEADEFRIVLCTGGPHVYLVGELNQGEPDRVRVRYEDWGESGELFEFDHDTVLKYCQQFYFGE